MFSIYSENPEISLDKLTSFSFPLPSPPQKKKVLTGKQINYVIKKHSMKHVLGIPGYPKGINQNPHKHPRSRESLQGTVQQMETLTH